MDESDRRYYREFHDYTTTPRILHFESKHDQCATKEERTHREDDRREQDTPIRYASDEEREHLSTLDNDSDEDDSDTSTSDGNEKENKEKDNAMNDQNVISVPVLVCRIGGTTQTGTHKDIQQPTKQNSTSTSSFFTI
jgi:hypothetical protein